MSLAEGDCRVSISPITWTATLGSCQIPGRPLAMQQRLDSQDRLGVHGPFSQPHLQTQRMLQPASIFGGTHQVRSDGERNCSLPTHLFLDLWLPVLTIFSTGPWEYSSHHQELTVYPMPAGTFIWHTELTLVCFETILGSLGLVEPAPSSHCLAPILDAAETLSDILHQFPGNQDIHAVLHPYVNLPPGTPRTQ